MAKLCQAPFIKVEATKFTEVGFHGKDVDQIIRDLLDISISMTKKRLKEVGGAEYFFPLQFYPSMYSFNTKQGVKKAANALAEEQLIEMLASKCCFFHLTILSLL